MTEDSDRAMRELATNANRFMKWVHQNGAATESRTEIQRMLQQRLGDGAAQSVVSRDLPLMEQVNLQVALDAWMKQDGRTVDVHGIFVPKHYGSADLTGLITGTGSPVQLVAPAMTDLPDGPSSTRACFTRALLLVSDADGDYALFVTTGEHEPVLELEIAGLPAAKAQAVFASLDALRDELNVYRGQLVQAHAQPMGGIRLDFLDPTPMDREQLILPDDVLRRIEGQALDVAAHGAALRRAGQHLKRGILLYGPPGTGKTHTVRYLLGRLPRYTRLLLQGAALHGIGPATEMARKLAPAVVVLEDVDLVARDRSFGSGDDPILFELLDAMDGAAADSDLMFLLTTNRVEVLEEALVARPGRIDVAVHIDRPDAQARAQLFRLYAANAPLEVTTKLADEVSEATEGVTASFLKELVRRSVLTAAQRDSSLPSVSADDVRSALADLLDSSQGVTRALLGAGDEHIRDSDDEVQKEYFPGIQNLDGRARFDGEPGGAGWFAYAPDSDC